MTTPVITFNAPNFSVDSDDVAEIIAYENDTPIFKVILDCVNPEQHKLTLVPLRNMFYAEQLEIAENAMSWFDNEFFG